MAVAGRMQKSRAQTMTWKAREVTVKWPLLCYVRVGGQRASLDGLIRSHIEEAAPY